MAVAIGAYYNNNNNSCACFVTGNKDSKRAIAIGAYYNNNNSFACSVTCNTDSKLAIAIGAYYNNNNSCACFVTCNKDSKLSIATGAYYINSGACFVTLNTIVQCGKTSTIRQCGCRKYQHYVGNFALRRFVAPYSLVILILIPFHVANNGRVPRTITSNSRHIRLQNGVLTSVMDAKRQSRYRLATQ